MITGSVCFSALLACTAMQQTSVIRQTSLGVPPPERTLVLSGGGPKFFSEATMKRNWKLLNEPDNPDFRKLLAKEQFAIAKLKSGQTLVYPTYESYAEHRVSILKELLEVSRQLSDGKVLFGKDLSKRLQDYLKSLTMRDISEQPVSLERNYNVEVFNGEKSVGDFNVGEKMGSSKSKVEAPLLKSRDNLEPLPESPIFVVLGVEFSATSFQKGRKVEKAKEALEWFKAYIDKTLEQVDQLESQFQSVSFPGSGVEKQMRAKKGMIADLSPSFVNRVRFSQTSKPNSDAPDVGKYGYSVKGGTMTVMVGDTGVGITSY